MGTRLEVSRLLDWHKASRSRLPLPQVGSTNFVVCVESLDIAECCCRLRVEECNLLPEAKRAVQREYRRFVEEKKNGQQTWTSPMALHHQLV